MTVNDVIQIINGCGFPIVACGAMAWFIVWTKQQNIENRKYNYDNLKEAIDNNSAVVKELCEFLRRGEKK